MTTNYNLRAWTNATFKLTRDLSNLKQVHDLAACTIRMQARLTALSEDPPVYEWCTTNVVGGVVSWDPVTGLCVFSAPETDMARMPARLVYDCRLETIGGAIAPLFSGRLTFAPGVTRAATEARPDNLEPGGDTVAVEGEVSSQPAVLPVAMTAIVAAAQDARAAAVESAQDAAASAASVSPSGLAAAIAALPRSERVTLFQALCEAAPDANTAAPGQAAISASGFFIRAG